MSEKEILAGYGIQLVGTCREGQQKKNLDYYHAVTL